MPTRALNEGWTRARAEQEREWLGYLDRYDAWKASRAITPRAEAQLAKMRHRAPRA